MSTIHARGLGHHVTDSIGVDTVKGGQGLIALAEKMHGIEQYLEIGLPDMPDRLHGWLQPGNRPRADLENRVDAQA